MVGYRNKAMEIAEMYQFKHIETFYLHKAANAVGMKNVYDMEDQAIRYDMAIRHGVLLRAIGHPSRRELREANNI